MTAASPGALPAARSGPVRTELLERLASGVLELTSSAAWTRWLRVSRRFHNYSFPNQALILSQRPDATWVAGYRAWARMGRQVREGERSIRILAPCLAPGGMGAAGEPPAPRVLGFRVARVFDLAQTSGVELPQPVHRLVGSGSELQLAELGQRALELGFQVHFVELWGSRNGDCSHALRRIRVSAGLAAAHQLKTLAHELAHAVLHGPEFQGSRALAELEAESVAYVVCQELGVESRTYSFGYLASWAGGGPEAARQVTGSGARILRAVSVILDPPEQAGAD